jgi:hypothetical protein
MVILKEANVDRRSATMKIYLFDPETGVYQGEDFTDDQQLLYPQDGALPPYATTVAPPPYQRGEVPVFASTKKLWEMQVLSAPAAGAGSETTGTAGLPNGETPQQEGL